MFPIKYIDNNLVWNKNNEVFAYYELIPYNYSFLSAEQKFIVPLTKSEYLICEYLASNKGQVFSKEQIYEATFSLYGESDSSTISTHIKNIRSKFEKTGVQPIVTVWGIGYRWE